MQETEHNLRIFTPEELYVLQLSDERALLAVFRLLRIFELGSYYPLFEQRDNEHKVLELCVNKEMSADANGRLKVGHC